VGVLALTWLLLRRVASARHWWLLAGGGIAAIVLSSPSVVLVATGVAVCLLALARIGRERLPLALAPVLVVAGFSLAWWLLVLRPAVSPALELYWADNYVQLGAGVAEVARSVGRVGAGFVRGASPLGLAFAPLLLAAFVLALRRNVLLGLTVVAPVAVAFVLAVAEAAPFGTGRTDLYLYPAVAAAVALAVDGLRRAWVPPAALAASVLLGAVAFVRTDDRYPIEDVRPLVADVEAAAGPEDAIVAFPLAAYSYGLYTRLPVEFRDEDAAATGFALQLDRPRTFVTGEAFPHDLERFEQLVRDARGSRTVWSVVSSPNQQVSDLVETDGAAPDETVAQYVERVFRSFGYRGERVRTTDGAQLTRWTRF
jgi:hypothetical protein